MDHQCRYNQHASAFVGRCFSLLGWLVGAVIGKVQGATISAIVERRVSVLGDSRLPPARLQCCGETVPAWGTLLGPSHLSTKHNTNLFPQTSVQVPVFISIRMRIPVCHPPQCCAPLGVWRLAVSRTSWCRLCPRLCFPPPLLVPTLLRVIVLVDLTPCIIVFWFVKAAVKGTKIAMGTFM